MGAPAIAPDAALARALERGLRAQGLAVLQHGVVWTKRRGRSLSSRLHRHTALLATSAEVVGAEREAKSGAASAHSAGLYVESRCVGFIYR